MIVCKGCGAQHANAYVGAESEASMYRVMELDAPAKSYFCDPRCFYGYRARQAQNKPAGPYVLSEAEREVSRAWDAAHVAPEDY